MKKLKLGIAISTLNRRHMLLELLKTLQKRTSCEYEVVVCDDGSVDDTVEAVRVSDVPLIHGPNRGVAWNKNRGLFYLRELRGSDVILLLDDDVVPLQNGWERDWIEAARRLGHVNFFSTDLLIEGSNTPQDPGISDTLWGPCIAFSRQALAYVGYMDPRFTGYGHEHTDLTMRCIRAGFGGYVLRQNGKTSHRFFSIEGSLRLLPSESHYDEKTVLQNEKVLAESISEPIYRLPWRNVEDYKQLRSELESPPSASHPNKSEVQPKGFSSFRSYMFENLAPSSVATQSSTSRWSYGRSKEQDATRALTEQANGKRKFHTDLEVNPWWEADLGTTSEIWRICIYNTNEEVARDRFRHFRVSIAVEKTEWVEVFEKTDDELVGSCDDYPFVWTPEVSIYGRFIRITAIGTCFLHLDCIEIYGIRKNTVIFKPEL